MSDALKTDSSAFLVEEPPVVNIAESRDQLKEELFSGKLKQENLEKLVADLKRENRHLNARIRGYQTLSQLLEEAKRELKHHKQRNADLQRKLDSLNSTEYQLDENDTEAKESSPTEEQNEMDQQSTTAAKVETDNSDNPAPTNTSTQRSTLGPNATHESNTTTHNADLVTAESQMAESKQFMSDSKENPKGEIDFSSKARMPLQSNPDTKDTESFTTTQHTQKDESNKDFIVTCDKPIKDASGSSGLSFVVLPGRASDEPSSTVSLWSMPDLSLPSVLSSMDASNVDSGEYIRSQSEESIDDQDEVASQIKSISEALNQICNLSSQSTLAPELARLTAQTLKVEKQLRLKKTVSESLVAEYEKLRKQVNLILPEYERQITQVRLENEQLLRRVRKLEQERDQLVPKSQSSENVRKADDWVKVDNTTLRTDGGTLEEEEKQSAATLSYKPNESERTLLNEVEKLKERNTQLTDINAKWDEHCKELQVTHEKEMTELRRKAFESQASLEREAQEAIRELKKRIKELEEDKKVAVSKEVKRRERAQGEAAVLQMAKEDLENRAKILEAQIEFYRNNPPLASLQETEGQMDSVTTLNVQELRSQFRLQRQQISIFQEDFQTERHDREKLGGEIDSLKAQIIRLKQELKAAQEQVRQATIARQMEMERRIINIPPHHNMTYTINPRDAYTGPQVAAGWQWQQVARKWRCARCTYDNEPVRRNCELCGAVKTSGSIYGPAEPGSAAAAREASGTLEIDESFASENLVHRHLVEECDNGCSPSTKLSSARDDSVLD